jgi:hypothetical protein
MSLIFSLLMGANVLVLGESHMSLPQSLINPLHEELSRHGMNVHSIGACGASAADWLKTNKVDCGADRQGSGAAVYKGPGATTTAVTELISRDKSKLVLVIIGDTMASYDDPSFPKAWAWKEVTGLVKAINSTGTACAWVGPPWGKAGGKYMKNDARTELMSKFLAANVAPCTYIDSLKFSKPGQWQTIDGQHFSVIGYQLWAKAITGAVLKLPVIQEIGK